MMFRRIFDLKCDLIYELVSNCAGSLRTHFNPRIEAFSVCGLEVILSFEYDLVDPGAECGCCCEQIDASAV
jgi:hypothetical protein